jgi:hypothetical protein
MAEHQDKRRESAVEKESTGPIRLVLLITVVQKGKGTFFSDYLQETFGSNLQIAIVGNGTAEDNLAEFLGLKETRRSVIFSVVREDRVDAILEALKERFHTINRDTGIAFTVPLSSVIGKLSYAFLSDDRRMLKED